MVYTDGIHLVGDTSEELHAFAARIGLKREWFQNHGRYPHYDVWGIKLIEAVNKGAKAMRKRELLELLIKKPITNPGDQHT